MGFNQRLWLPRLIIVTLTVWFCALFQWIVTPTQYDAYLPVMRTQTQQKQNIAHFSFGPRLRVSSANWRKLHVPIFMIDGVYGVNEIEKKIRQDIEHTMYSHSLMMGSKASQVQEENSATLKNVLETQNLQNDLKEQEQLEGSDVQVKKENTKKQKKLLHERLHIDKLQKWVSKKDDKDPWMELSWQHTYEIEKMQFVFAGAVEINEKKSVPLQVTIQCYQDELLQKEILFENHQQEGILKIPTPCTSVNRVRVLFLNVAQKNSIIDVIRLYEWEVIGRLR